MNYQDELLRKLNGDDAGVGNTGVSGGLPVVGSDIKGPDPAMPTPAAPAPPSYDMGRVMGVDAGKFNDPNKHDFKYDTMRTLSQFDPRQGITQDVINALNQLDYGTFAGSGDKLSLSGAKNAKDAGDFANQDWIGGFKSGDGKWNYGGGAVANQEAQQAQRPQGGGMFSGSTIAPLLQSDAQANVQNALGKFGQADDSNYLQQLIAALGGAA